MINSLRSFLYLRTTNMWFRLLLAELFNWDIVSMGKFLGLSNRKYFNVILPFFKKLCKENKLAKSASVLLFNINSINSLQKYLRIIESYVLCSKNICYNFFIPCEFLNFFQNLFNSRTIKKCYIIIIHISNYPKSSYGFCWSWFVKHAPNFVLGQIFLE